MITSRSWKKFIYKQNASQGGVLCRGIWQHQFHLTTFNNLKYVVIAVITKFDLIKSEIVMLYTLSKKWETSWKKMANLGRFIKNLVTPSFNSFL